MLPTEQAKFFEVITTVLGAYSKQPTADDLQAWWNECRGLTIDALESAIKSHRDDPERGERAPRPIDISRRMKAGSRDSAMCAARDAQASCAYPGIFSDGTMGEGPWYCPLHRNDHAGPEASRRIEYSHSVPWEEFRAKQTAKRLAESQRAAPVVNTAHAIAKRHGNRPWQTGLAEMLPAQRQDDEAA